MKRTKFAAALAVLTLLTTLTGCGQAKEADGALEPVTLNEVAHSIFYAPQYAAIELGYFKDEGIALTLVNGAGADKVMTSLISGDADIGFMGSEASIYVYQEGSADYAVNFAQLTQRAGNFLVGRSAEPDFSWQDLKGKFPFDGVQLDVGKLAIWRLQTHAQFGGTWLSDYVPNRLGGFVQEQRPQRPKMELLGQDGNIFAILGRASALLKRAGMKDQADEMFQRVTASGSYEQALNIISEYVETELTPPPIHQKSNKKKARDAHER